MGLVLTIRCVGKFILILLVSFSLSSCFSSKSKKQYALSGVDKYGCAMFQPVGEGTFMAVVIWKTRDGKYTAGHPGKDNCEKAKITKHKQIPELRKTNTLNK